MAKVFPIGKPANDSERRAISFLRDHLPDDWKLFHNFELRQRTEVFEIDIALLGPHAVYLIDAKGTHGNIDVYGARWYPEGRQSFFSPLAKLRNHAKVLSSMIADRNRGDRDLQKIHVQAAVLLTEDDAILSDPSGIDGPDVTDFKHCLRYLNDTTRIPAHRAGAIGRYHGQIAGLLAQARPRSAALVFRDWQVEERLGGTDHYTDFRAKHSLFGKSAGAVRLRVYQADPYQDEPSREAELNKISNAYRALVALPPHANVLSVRDFFLTEEQDKAVLVTEDVPGQPLRLHLNKASLALTFDQKLQVMLGVLAGLGHAHAHEVVHRNLTPDAILVGRGGDATLTNFDFARVGEGRTATIAGQIVDDLSIEYQAPEFYADPAQASPASDLFSAGAVFYELLVGERPFETMTEVVDRSGEFPIKPSQERPDLAEGFDLWLQRFCYLDPAQRHVSAAVALQELNELLVPEARGLSSHADTELEPEEAPVADDLASLPKDAVLNDRFRVESKLGSGGFGVVYRVFDALGDVQRVIKLITKDRQSVYERLKREYKTLTGLPEHPNVVKVVWADRMNDVDHTPYILFEYVDGLDVSQLVDARALSVDDAVRIAREAAQGLRHLHEHGVYHQDVKPSNLLWTDGGVRIIDFNVAVSESDPGEVGGGTRRYLPPDFDFSRAPGVADRIDRDLYALGITFYQCLTGDYPFSEPTPPLKTQPRDPKQFSGCADLSESLTDVVLKLIAPERRDRYISADQLLAALALVKRLRVPLSRPDQTSASLRPRAALDLGTPLPNTNPFVSRLLTLYSQSRVSNAGTRGLDDIGRATYVPTYLDEKLQPALLAGDYRLAVISGNAGDGKTAFIQQLELAAESRGAQIQRGANGAVFKLGTHSFVSNHDGSQDEGDDRNDAVLQRFFAPFGGRDPKQWPSSETRVIAINEGRLVDFFLEHEDEFPRLAAMVRRGLAGGAPSDGVAIINLNLRSVVAPSDQGGPSIMERLITQLTNPDYWGACQQCDLKAKCYAYHNAQTFQDPVAGPRVVERLKTLHTVTHLRGRLHITMRDLRSAMAFMLVGTRDCASIHELYQQTGEETQNCILDAFYFNSWLGGVDGSPDRLVSLLGEIDVAEASNPELDRELSYLGPTAKRTARFDFADRGTYDNDLAEALFRKLPRDLTLSQRGTLIAKHHTYLAHTRRRHFFECRGPEWQDMLPYKSVGQFLSAIQTGGVLEHEEVTWVLHAINHGEGLADSTPLGDQLALRVRQVERGTIRSYRVFDGARFTLGAEQVVLAHPFLEGLPQALTLTYEPIGGQRAALRVTLDIYEMLTRLKEGYEPSVEERGGLYLSLSVFKNVLASAPYQEVLLTETGHEFFQIRRDPQGVLWMKKMGEGWEP